MVILQLVNTITRKYKQIRSDCLYNGIKEIQITNTDFCDIFPKKKSPSLISIILLLSIKCKINHIYPILMFLVCDSVYRFRCSHCTRFTQVLCKANGLTSKDQRTLFLCVTNNTWEMCEGKLRVAINSDCLIFFCVKRKFLVKGVDFV